MISNEFTKNKQVLKFVEESANLCKPDKVVWITGDEAQLEELRQEALKTGELIKLNEEKLPGCYLHRSDVNDVARVEGRTFICCDNKDDAGPINNWMDPKEAYAKVGEIFDGSMKGRTMYVIPYSMGAVGSTFSKAGIEVTDSIYVVVSMKIMTRIGQEVLDVLGDSNDFVRGLHSKAQLDPEKRYILHFPQDNTIWSVNSGYGGNVLLGLYSTDPEVIGYGMNRLAVISASYCLCGMMDVMVGSIRGLGYAVMPMIVSLLGACALRVIWVLTIFQMYHTQFSLYISYPISWIVTAGVHFCCYLVVRKKVFARLEDKIA